MQVVEYKREWTYLNLAVNGLTGQWCWDWTENMKGEPIAPVVQQWAEDGVEVVVWDRTRGHRGPTYQEVAVKLIKQPSYSLELNPAERVFEYLRSKVEGQVYGTMADKKEAIKAKLLILSGSADSSRSLAGWDWIHQSVAGLWQSNTVYQQVIGIRSHPLCDSGSQFLLKQVLLAEVLPKSCTT
ncbi:MAG: hypothetical protein SVX38_10365 [Chloroflexota bacterium]|nr:hypothetical protein [Chloroflexota bacterium]